MGIKNEYHVMGIPKEQTYEWLLKKHYAHRIPSISFAFGLYDKDKLLQGVCTFGMPANYVEMKAWEPYNLLELNRLVVSDDGVKNKASILISRSLSYLPHPTVCISYADPNNGRHGYIYQATNWVYTGVGGGSRDFVLVDGTVIHQRHSAEYDKELIAEIKNTEGKHRYYFFVGDKKQKKY